MSKTAIFCFVCFCQSLAVCEAILCLFFFNFALFTFFLVRQNFTGANNLTKKWEGGIFYVDF